MSPFVIVIFGATGDLAQHKLFPALFNLYKSGQLGEKFYIVGFARRDFTDEAYAHMLGDELELHKDETWQKFAKNIYIKAFVDGVTAAAIGAIVGAVFILGQRSIIDIPTAVIALVSAIILYKFKKIQEPHIVIIAATKHLTLVT